MTGKTSLNISVMMKSLKSRHFSSLLIVLLICVSNAYTQDWPQYLGPDRNSVSPQQNLLRSWPENGPEVLWTVNVGRGYGGPVVKDGKIYLLDRDDKVGENMRCYDLNSGEKLWNLEYEAPGSVMFPGSRSVPTLDGNYVYSCGQNGDLYCIDINTHKAVWNKNVWTDFGGEALPIWAISQCLLVYKDMLLVASQAPEAGVVAYDKLTGEIVWKTLNLGNETYVSPAIVQIDGDDHVVMITSSTNNIGYPDAEPTLGTVVGIEPLRVKSFGSTRGGNVIYQCQVQLMPITIRCWL